MNDGNGGDEGGTALDDRGAGSLVAALPGGGAVHQRLRRRKIPRGDRAAGDNDKAIDLSKSPVRAVVNYARLFGGDTALHIACASARQLGRLSAQNGADPNLPDSQWRHGADHRRAPRLAEGAAMLRCQGLGRRHQSQGETALIVAVQHRQRADRQALARGRRQARQAPTCRRLSARDYAKRDRRSTEMLKLIETVKSTKKAGVRRRPGAPLN
jgi:hypothetical protein